MLNNVTSVGGGQDGAVGSPFSAAQQQAWSAVAGALGMSSGDLQNAVRGGQSLSDIAQAKGVSQQDLNKVVSDALRSALPNAQGSQIANLASQMTTGHAHRRHGHHLHGAAAAPASTDQTATTGQSLRISVMA